jgi:hypothetical protein
MKENIMKNLSKAIALVGAMTASTAAFADGHESAVEVSASAGVATSYLFRGAELGQGSAMVYGDIGVSAAGAYAGVWIASGDAALGTEYDLFVGYGGEVGGLSYDINLTNYVYPTGTAAAAADLTTGEVELGRADGGDDLFDFTEVILSLGYAGASFTYIDTVAGGQDKYYALGYEAGAISATVGITDKADETADYTHVDVTYAYSDNLSFTASKIVDEDTDGTNDDDLNLVATYSLPL